MSDIAATAPRVAWHARFAWLQTLRAAATLPRTRLGLAIAGLVVAIALLGPLLAPHSPTQFVAPPYDPPSAKAWFGTDYLGRDTLSRFLWGGRSILGLSAAATAIGLLLGVVVTRVHRVTRSVPVVSDTVSLLTPFASYLLADLLGTSGILSVVATGLYAARTVPRVLGPELRQQITGMWTVVTFLLESLVFILVGFELHYITRALDRFALSMLLREAGIVSLCVVLVRIAWVMPSAYIFRWFFRWLRHGHEPIPSWRSILFVAWTGLRGADSLVLALSLPLLTASGARFPARDQIIFITFCVIFITLVVQGPTIAPFARLLGIRANDEEVAEEAHARLAAAEAGARRWAAREQEPHDAESEDVAHDHDHFTIAPSHEAAAIDDRRGEEYRRVRSAMLHAETEAILDLRDRGVIDDDVMRRIQRDFDLETLLLETSEPVIETVSEVPSAIDAAAR